MNNKTGDSKLKELKKEIKAIKAEKYAKSEKAYMDRRVKELREKSFEFKLSNSKSAESEFISFILNEDQAGELIEKLIKTEIGAKVRTSWSQGIRDESLISLKLPIKLLNKPENLYLKDIVVSSMRFAFRNLEATINLSSNEKSIIKKAFVILDEKVGNKALLDKMFRQVSNLLLQSPELKKDCMSSMEILKMIREEIQAKSKPEYSMVMYSIESTIIRLLFPDLQTGMDRKSYDQRKLRMRI